jgi:hypothetical protein
VLHAAVAHVIATARRVGVLDRLAQQCGSRIETLAGDITETGSPAGSLRACTERPDTHVQVAEFPSYEKAMANSALPETTAFAGKLSALCVSGPTFRRSVLATCGVRGAAGSNGNAGSGSVLGGEA